VSKRRSLHGGGEGRPNAAARGYGSLWRKRAAAHLERVRQRQEAEGWPGGPWCECEVCENALLQAATAYEKGWPSWASPLQADTVDHRRPRRLFPLELQGSDAPGGSDHPDNLRAMAHGHHSRRRDDKVRRRE
jgi:hypothetical protein